MYCNLLLTLMSEMCPALISHYSRRKNRGKGEGGGNARHFGGILGTDFLPSSECHGQYRHSESGHGYQMAKFDPFLSLDCARVEGVGAQYKERKGSNFAA